MSFSDEGWDERQAQLKEDKKKAPRHLVKEDVTTERYQQKVHWGPQMRNKHPETTINDSGYYVAIPTEENYD